MGSGHRGLQGGDILGLRSCNLWHLLLIKHEKENTRSRADNVATRRRGVVDPFLFRPGAVTAVTLCIAVHLLQRHLHVNSLALLAQVAGLFMGLMPLFGDSIQHKIRTRSNKP